MVSPHWFVVHRGASGGLVVGHLALGNGLAGGVQRRGGEEQRSWTATVLRGGEPVHGANDAGVMCAVVGGGGLAAVRTVLDGAQSVDEAVALLRAEPVAPAHDACLVIADARGAAAVTVTASGEVTMAGVDVEAGGDGAVRAEAPSVAAACARLRAMEPAPVEGLVPAAALVALLAPGEPPHLHIALGPPCCSVFIRHWPGMELVPDESASPEGSVLARLAAAVAATTATDADLRAAARARLDEVEAEALAEGEAAERMAQRMDADTDDRGAAVRRLVAQAHAVELARGALEELAVPAPPGSRTGPRL